MCGLVHGSSDRLFPSHPNGNSAYFPSSMKDLPSAAELFKFVRDGVRASEHTTKASMKLCREREDLWTTSARMRSRLWLCRLSPACLCIGPGASRVCPLRARYPSRVDTADIA